MTTFAIFKTDGDDTLLAGTGPHPYKTDLSDRFSYQLVQNASRFIGGNRKNPTTDFGL